MRIEASIRERTKRYARPQALHANSLIDQTIPNAGIPEYDSHKAKISRLLSALSWSYGDSLHIDAAIQSTNPAPVAVANIRRTQPVPSGLWLFEPTTKAQQRALASYREAAAAWDIPAVSFLWYFRAIEAACESYRSKILVPFIDQLEPLLSGRALEQWRSLATKQGLGAYLVTNRRNSIAHAAWPDTYDADDVAAVRGISEDLILIEQVAKLAMTNTLRIPSFDQMVEAGRSTNEPQGWVPLAERNR